MDITDFRSLSTVICFIALAGVFYWTFHPRSKKGFDEASQLPFSDDELNEIDHKKKEQKS